MSIYVPNLKPYAGTKAERIAQAISADIVSGALSPGQRLPPHRDLAHALRVTPGTVSRAYGLLARRGVLSGEVGRGSFVRDPSAPDADLSVRPQANGANLAAPRTIDLAVNRQPSPDVQHALSIALEQLARDSRALSLMTYLPDGGAYHHREAFSTWVGNFGVQCDPGRVIATAGALHGLYTIFRTLAKPGEAVFVEEFTYAGFKALASELQLRLEPLPLDDKGLVPEAIEERAKHCNARWIYLMPGLQNPTATSMPLDRRRKFAKLAEKHDLMIVEDGVYDFLSDEKISPIASLLPERTFYMTSLSKCVAAGLRAGCIVAPDAYVERLASSIRRMMWMTPPLGLEVATRWIREGVLEQLLSQQTEEFTERRRMAEVAFDKLKFTAPKAAAFIWLQLSQGVTSSELIAVAERNGVTLAPTDAFSVRKNRSKDFLRVSLSACRTPEELSHALNIVAKAADGSLISDIGYY